MPQRRTEMARAGRVASLLLIAGVAGSLLGACGGGSGSALTTRTEVTATRPEATVPTAPTRTSSRPSPTTTEPAPEPTTTVLTTTVEQPTTTRPAVTVTIETQTTTATSPIVPTTTTTETAETEPTTTAVAAPPPSSSSSSGSNPWPWIVLGAVLAAGLVIGLVLWRRRRAGAANWTSHRADLTQRALVALDDVLAQGSVVTGQVEALAAEARSLEQRAPDDAAKGEAARIRARLDELAGVMESDRSLHLASPPPSPEQLSYSAALIRQKVQELQGVLRPPPPPPGTATP